MVITDRRNHQYVQFLLTADVAAANRFRQEQEGWVPNLAESDLRAAYLPDLDLHGVDAHGADFTGAVLNGADFTHANLSGARFVQALMDKTDLRHAIVKGADFTDASLQGTKFPAVRKSPRTRGFPSDR